MLIASGNRGTITRLGDYEGKFAEGDKGIITLKLSGTAGEGIVRVLQASLDHAGVEQWRPVEETPGRLRIYFSKGAPWLAIILAILLSLIILWLILVGWELEKIIPGFGKWGVLIAGGALIALAAYAVSKGRLKL